MNIRDFEYITKIDRFSSFSQAARQCNISQPALSIQIAKIEDRLGYQIFERDNQQVLTTAKGKELVLLAQEILQNFQQIQDIKNDKLSVKIGIIPTICPYLLPHIVEKLQKKLPAIRFYFFEYKTETLLQKLNNGELDLAILVNIEGLIDERFIYEKLYDEEFFLALPKKSKFESCHFEKILQNKMLILLEEGNCMSDNVKSICSRYKNSNFSDFYATSIETVKNMILINNGAALLPKLSILKEKNLKISKFSDEKSREVGIIARNSYVQGKVFAKISNIITRCYNKIK